ncbi:enoyl-CoA hydratase/isomerase family protein [Hoeflea sp. TYP-13]|uniref:enoyl-CoA hydratase/isomerase family protein n=1 Tax=Hoeflea sp. TYP-13 TaxID=3230023 RepID=UPI0034C64675
MQHRLEQAAPLWQGAGNASSRQPQRPAESLAMNFETIKLDVTSNIATITLNRPDDANALNAQMAQELFHASVYCANDAEIRAVVITGTGRMFCAGGDLKDMHEQGEDKPAHVVRMATYLHAAITRFAHMDAPVVMAVNGTAAGGGFSLALAGDYVLAAQEAKFVSAYTASGLTPDGSSTFYLAKHVGLLRAKELLFTNRRLSAEEACAWGIVNKVVPAARLMEEAEELAANFASGPTKAYGGLKRLLLTAYSDTMETQLEKETQGISGMMRTHDGPHGLESFLDKNRPQFKGR